MYDENITIFLVHLTSDGAHKWRIWSCQDSPSTLTTVRETVPSAWVLVGGVSPWCERAGRDTGVETGLHLCPPKGGRSTVGWRGSPRPWLVVLSGWVLSPWSSPESERLGDLPSSACLPPFLTSVDPATASVDCTSGDEVNRVKGRNSRHSCTWERP